MAVLNVEHSGHVTVIRNQRFVLEYVQATWVYSAFYTVDWYLQVSIIVKNDYEIGQPTTTYYGPISGYSLRFHSDTDVVEYLGELLRREENCLVFRLFPLQKPLPFSWKEEGF